MLPFPITIGGKVLGLEQKEENNNSQQQQQQKQMQMQPTWWLYTSFEEGSYGWFFNSSRNDRQRIGSSLACLLRSLGNNETQPDAVYRILDTVVRPYLTTSVATSTHGNGAAYGLDKDSFGLDGDALENRRLAQYLAYVGCHYWIVRPVLLLAVDLAHGISKGAETARSGLASHPQHDKELQSLFAWAERTVGSKQSVGICSSAALFFGTDKPNDHDEEEDDDGEGGFSQSTHLSPALYREERGGAAETAATPDSAFSSPSTSLKHRKSARDTIDIAELRRANNNNNSNSNGELQNGMGPKQGLGLGITTTTTTAEQPLLGHKRRRERWQEAQTFLLDHWKRTCEADLAQMLVRLSTALMHPEGEKKGQDNNEYQRPPNAHDWALALVDMHSRHTSAREAAETALQQELHTKQEELAEADDRAAALLDELQRVQSHSSELSRAIERHQAVHGEMEQESKRMRT
ncbi:hypothetical protein GGI11_008388, partial [Coemansia sp. RSA 2049]